MPDMLVIRADANAQMGTGHLMRCLAMGQAGKDIGGRISFITSCSDESLLERLYGEGFIVHRLGRSYPDERDWGMTQRLLAENPNAWLVVDGYHFDSEYQRQVRAAGHRLMVIDDSAHLPHYYADIVVNQNIHAKELGYDCEPDTQLLLGTKYALLRREFLKWRGWKREIPEVARKVLVTMGGSDAGNVTLKTIQALQHLEIDGFEATIVAGASNPNFSELQSAVRASQFPLRLERNVTNMPDLMAWADIAISAGGSTCWELAFMSLPSVVLPLANNQHPVAEGLEKAKVVVNLGRPEGLSPAEIATRVEELLLGATRRLHMSQRGQGLVDGNGSARVLACMGRPGISLRQVREEDCELLWKWATDPDVRAVSFVSDPIPWEQHIEWFKSKLNDRGCVFYVATNGNNLPIGQVRYEVKGREAVISVSVDRSHRGKGYGSTIIQLASERVFTLSEVSVIHAYVKKGNEASLKVFVKDGFKTLETTVIKGQQAIHLALDKKT